MNTMFHSVSFHVSFHFSRQTITPPIFDVLTMQDRFSDKVLYLNEFKILFDIYSKIYPIQQSSDPRQLLISGPKCDSGCRK